MLTELISRRMPLGEINHAFDLMRQGEVKRSVIVYECLIIGSPRTAGPQPRDVLRLAMP